MAADIKGTAHWFGVNATLTNATIMSLSCNESFKQEDETVQEGLTIETRRDDRQKEVTMTVRPRTNYTVPTIGSIVILSGVQDSTYNDNYELTSKAAEFVTDGHAELTLNLINHEAITY